MFALPTFQLSNVVVVHIDCHCGHRLLPSSKRIELEVTVNAVVCPGEELLAQFKPLNKHNPSEPDISFAQVRSLLLEPVALLLDKLAAFRCQSLRSKFYEVVAGPMSVDCLRSDHDSSL